MKAGAVCLLVLGLSGCGRPADFVGPAPAGALECSLAYAESAGYELVNGGVEHGFLRLVQRVNPEPPNPGPREPRPALDDLIPDLREPLPENDLLVQVDDGRLRLTVVRSAGRGTLEPNGPADPDAPVPAGSSAEDQARTMLAMCTSTPPVFPPAR